MAATSLYNAVSTAASITDRVLVFFSGGKDSVCTLDLCSRYFKRVQPVLMQLGPVLSFQQAMIDWAEDKYGVEVMVVPHPMLSEWLRYFVWIPRLDMYEIDPDVPIISFADIYHYVRLKTGIWWIAAGERLADSMVRRAMIKGDGGSINPKRGRFFPVADWNKADVLTYIKQRRLKIAPEYKILGFSFRSLMPADMAKIKEHYNADYVHLREWFPLLDIAVANHEFFGRKQNDASQLSIRKARKGISSVLK